MHKTFVMTLASFVSRHLYVRVPEFWVRTLKIQTPRVRFAPSPTGFLHLGGLRTALYNYLFATSNGGSMILRIEDTDRARKVEGAVEALVENLEWVGIRCHEGPSQGGDYGPYVQSERLDLYKEHVKRLLVNGTAYRCFCTPRRLDLLRRDAQRRQQLPKYDNRCRNLSKQEVKDRLDAGTEHCIRFQLTSECLHFEDLIFGGIGYDVTLNEGDPVIMKSDGFPTYHFANVVDDHLMRITHVLRGVEWQISTTKHILMYRALGWEPPRYGHLPLIVNSDGAKLSKRQRDATVEDYRRRGVLPLALVNYITLTGGGFDHVPGEGVRLATMDRLAVEFRLEKISSHPSRLNPDLIAECNRLEIARQLQTSSSDRLVRDLRALIQNTFPEEKLELSQEHINNVLNWSTSRISRIEDLVTKEYAYLWVLPKECKGVDDDSKKILSQLGEHLRETTEFDERSLKTMLRRFAETEEVQFVRLMKLLRSVLSGRGEGPGVAEMLSLLGRDVALKRIAVAGKTCSGTY